MSDLQVGDFVKITKGEYSEMFEVWYFKEGDIAEVVGQDEDGKFWAKALVEPYRGLSWCLDRCEYFKCDREGNPV